MIKFLTVVSLFLAGGEVFACKRTEISPGVFAKCAEPDAKHQGGSVNVNPILKAELQTTELNINSPEVQAIIKDPSHKYAIEAFRELGAGKRQYYRMITTLLGKETDQSIAFRADSKSNEKHYYIIYFHLNRDGTYTSSDGMVINKSVGGF